MYVFSLSTQSELLMIANRFVNIISFVSLTWLPAPLCVGPLPHCSLLFLTDYQWLPMSKWAKFLCNELFYAIKIRRLYYQHCGYQQDTVTEDNKLMRSRQTDKCALTLRFLLSFIISIMLARWRLFTNSNEKLILFNLKIFDNSIYISDSI